MSDNENEVNIIKQNGKVDKNKRFRLDATNLFLTFPRNDRKPEEALAKVRDLTGYEWAVLCQEKHKDGCNHLHILVHFGRQKTFRGFELLDSIGGTHGNYQAARSVVKVMKYVTKEGNFIEDNIDALDYLKKRENKESTKSSVVFKKIKTAVDAGENALKEVIKFDCGYALMHKKQIEDMERWLLAERDREIELQLWPPLGKKFLMPWFSSLEPYNQAITNWLILNLFKVRSFKQEQLYLVAPANCGKTTLLMQLEKFCHLYLIPEENSHEYYRNGGYDLCVFDEFLGNKPCNWLNSFLQGSPMLLKCKLCSSITKRDNPPVIIMSNIHPEDVYQKVRPSVIAAFLSRFLIIELNEDDFIRIPFLE